MKAVSILSYRQRLADTLIKEVRVWRLPAPVAGCAHPDKYRLALVSDDRCVLRDDNERGKGDHDQESALTFLSMPELLIDFDRDIQRWRDVYEHPDH